MKEHLHPKPAFYPFLFPKKKGKNSEIQTDTSENELTFLLAVCPELFWQQNQFPEGVRTEHVFILKIYKLPYKVKAIAKGGMSLTGQFLVLGEMLYPFSLEVVGFHA